MLRKPWPVRPAAHSLNTSWHLKVVWIPQLSNRICFSTMEPPKTTARKWTKKVSLGKKETVCFKGSTKGLLPCLQKPASFSYFLLAYCLFYSFYLDFYAPRFWWCRPRNRAANTLWLVQWCNILYIHVQWSFLRPVLLLLYVPRTREHPSRGSCLIQIKRPNFQEFRRKQGNNKSETMDVVKLGSSGLDVSNISNLTS